MKLPLADLVLLGLIFAGWTVTSQLRRGVAFNGRRCCYCFILAFRRWFYGEGLNCDCGYRFWLESGVGYLQTAAPAAVSLITKSTSGAALAILEGEAASLLQWNSPITQVNISKFAATRPHPNCQFLIRSNPDKTVGPRLKVL